MSSRNSAEILAAADSLDFLLITVNMPLDWTALLKTLKPNGRMHVVGAVLEPMPISAFDLIMKQKSVSGSPTGGPPAIAAMLDFAFFRQGGSRCRHERQAFSHRHAA